MKGTQSQEVKKVKEADIISAGLERGKTIADITQKVLGSTLKSKIQNKGIEAALTFCNLNAYPIVDSLSRLYSAEIKRVSLKNRNPGNFPDSIESIILEAYQYSVDNGDPVTENIQNIDNISLLYTRPIQIGDPMCLQCHGKAGEDIQKDTEKLLKELYPEDKARGYSITELRGMWSIRSEKKDIVNAL